MVDDSRIYLAERCCIMDTCLNECKVHHIDMVCGATAYAVGYVQALKIDNTWIPTEARIIVVDLRPLGRVMYSELAVITYSDFNTPHWYLGDVIRIWGCDHIFIIVCCTPAESIAEANAT